MTVTKLIQKLKKLPPTAKVWWADHDSSWPTAEVERINVLGREELDEIEAGSALLGLNEKFKATIVELRG